MQKLGILLVMAMIAASIGGLAPSAFAQKAFVGVTGQTTSYAEGDDGDLQAGVRFPATRFVAEGNGAVRDRLTGLIWLQDANCFGERSWQEALNAANHLGDAQCGLTDRSAAGDWRLPNVKELQSLIDYGHLNPALSPGHPFVSV